MQLLPGIHAVREPQVGNFAWEVFFTDPGGDKSTSPALPACPEKPCSQDQELKGKRAFCDFSVRKCHFSEALRLE